MFDDQHFKPPGRLAQFMRLVEAFERDEIETGVDRLIEMLDDRDGDADLEDGEGCHHDIDTRGRWLGKPSLADHRHVDADDPVEADGDELDTGNTEDEALAGFMVLDGGPGCLIGDPVAMEPGEPGEDFREVCDPMARQRHRDRIRATRCTAMILPSRSIAGRSAVEYRLREREA